MASTPVEFVAPSGQTCTLSLFAEGSDVLANPTSTAATERTNAKQIYTATVTEALVGRYDAVVKIGAVAIAKYVVDLLDDTNIHRCGEGGGLLDGILEDTGTTLDTLIDRIAVGCIGNVSGAGTGTEVFTYGGVTGTVTVDSSGNRTIVFS